MAQDFEYELLEDPARLAQFGGWSEPVYEDFLAIQRGTMSREQFRAKYLVRRAILNLDMTGFTQTSLRYGQINSLLRIVDTQKICIPVLQDAGASLIRAFADDLVALFESPDVAVDAAFEIHRRIDLFNQSELSSAHPTECCIGIGYGDVYGIGPNLAQGDEMNKASKLGEDLARGRETLLTENAHAALAGRSDIVFQPQSHDDILFAFFRARPAG